MNTQELIQLASEHPDLPIYFWVDSDICCGGDYSYYLAKASCCHLDRILISEDDERVYDDENDFKEEYLAMHEDEFEGKSDDEIDHLLNEICHQQPWQEVILMALDAG